MLLLAPAMQRAIFLLALLTACASDELRSWRTAPPDYNPPATGGDADAPAGGDTDVAPGADTDVPPGGDDAPAPQCAIDADCGPGPDACSAAVCSGGTCTTRALHDSLEWQSTPVLTPEIWIAPLGHPRRVLWDGDAFVVFWAGHLGRYDRQGQLIGNVLELDPATHDVAWDPLGERFILVTEELPNATPGQPQYHISWYTLSRAGAPLMPKTVFFGDSSVYSNTPHVAASRSGFVIVHNWGTWAQGKYFPAGGGEQPVYLGERVQNWYSRVPTVTAHHDTFVFSANDQHYYPGCNWEGECTLSNCSEVWGSTMGSATIAGTGWREMTNVQELPCQTQNNLTSFASGTRGLLMSTGAPIPHAVQVRLVRNDGSLGTPVYFDNVSTLDTFETPPVGFDGTNYLAVPETRSDHLFAYRFNEDAVRLDATPFSLTPIDGVYEQKVRIASDGAGRFLVAYDKGTLGTYIRLFSTCP
jgi:hypothetical protein